jgi:hypothetical protein
MARRSARLCEDRTVLAAVKTAARLLRRWPAASPDRRSARRALIIQAGAEKRRPTEQRNCEIVAGKREEEGLPNASRLKNEGMAAAVEPRDACGLVRTIDEARYTINADRTADSRHFGPGGRDSRFIDSGY